jgi:uncharacterized protein
MKRRKVTSKIKRSLKHGQEIKYSFIKILTGSDLTQRQIPVMKIKSTEDGPLVWLTGCIHGDEIGGIVVIQEIFEFLKKYGLKKGTVRALPLMNPLGFENVSREIPMSAEDINRVFPGDKTGSLAERMADTIFNTIKDKNPDIVIDIHNDWLHTIPYTLLEPKDLAGKNYNKIVELATVAGFPVIEEGETKEEQAHMLNTLTGSLVAAGVPAFTLELGPDKTVHEKFVDYGVAAILKILQKLEMIEIPENFEMSDLNWGEKYKNEILSYSHGERAEKSGIIRFIAKPSDEVEKGDTIARIYNTFGKLQESVVAQHDAIVLGHTDFSVAHPGMELYAFGYKK